MEYLAALPRGDDAMGFYATPAQRVPILSARLLSQLPDAGRPVVQVLRTDSSSYARWLEARRNRTDSWFVRPAGAIDLCNAMPPVRLR
jgi:peptidylprolyl isomerase